MSKFWTTTEFKEWLSTIVSQPKAATPPSYIDPTRAPAIVTKPPEPPTPEDAPETRHANERSARPLGASAPATSEEPPSTTVDVDPNSKPSDTLYYDPLTGKISTTKTDTPLYMGPDGLTLTKTTTAATVGNSGLFTIQEPVETTEDVEQPETEIGWDADSKPGEQVYYDPYRKVLTTKRYFSMSGHAVENKLVYQTKDEQYTFDNTGILAKAPDVSMDTSAPSLMTSELEPGKPMYLDPERNVITSKPTRQGANATLGNVPLYRTETGEMTFEDTGQLATYSADTALDNLARQVEVAHIDLGAVRQAMLGQLHLESSKIPKMVTTSTELLPQGTKGFLSTHEAFTWQATKDAETLKAISELPWYHQAWRFPLYALGKTVVNPVIRLFSLPQEILQGFSYSEVGLRNPLVRGMTWALNVAILGYEHLRLANSQRITILPGGGSRIQSPSALGANQGTRAQMGQDPWATVVSKYSGYAESLMPLIVDAYSKSGVTYFPKTQQEKVAEIVAQQARVDVASAITDKIWKSVVNDQYSDDSQLNHFLAGTWDDIPQILQHAATNRKLANQSLQLGFELMKQGKYEDALEATKDYVRYDLNANPVYNRYAAYTWEREPERFEAFLNDIALLTLQKGSVLTDEEVRRLREIHSNPATEISAALALDPLNALPATAMEKVLGSFKTAIAKLAPKGADAKALAPVLNFFYGESIRSTSRLLANTTSNILGDTLRSLSSRADIEEAFVSELSPILARASANRTESSLRALYSELLAGKHGAAFHNMTFADFTKMVGYYDEVSGTKAAARLADAEIENARLEKIADASGKPRGKEPLAYLKPEDWNKRFTESLDNALETVITNDMATIKHLNPEITDDELRLTEDALRETLRDTERVHSLGINLFSDSLRSSYLDAHRAFAGSNLVADQMLGKATRALARGGLLNIATFAEKTSDVLNSIIRGVWMTAVLALRPAWIVGNLTDSTLRFIIDGGDLLTDMKYLLAGTWGRLADEVGDVPVVLAQSLGSREGLSFLDGLYARYMYKGWKPKWGWFSYYAYDFNRLQNISKATTIAGGKPFTPTKRVLSGLYNSIKAAAGAGQDLNASIEFGLRLRAYHREYFRILNLIEPGYKARSLADVPEHLREVANSIWRAAKENPAKVYSYVNSLGGLQDYGDGAWRFTIPDSWEDTLRKMSPQDRGAFSESLGRQLDEYITQYRRKYGKTPDAPTLTKFVDDYKEHVHEAVQETLAQYRKLKNLSGQVASSGNASDLPSWDDLEKLSKEGADEVVEALAQVEPPPAIKQVKSGKVSGRGLTDAYSTSIGKSATVRYVDGAAVTVYSKDRRIFIDIGNALAATDRKRLLPLLRSATLDVLYEVEKEWLGVNKWFAHKQDFIKAVEAFIKSPTDTLASDTRLFDYFTRLFTERSDLRSIYESLSGKAISFDSADEIYRTFILPYVSGSEMSLKELRALNKAAADAKYKPPTFYRDAGEGHMAATRAFGEMTRDATLPADLRSLMLQYHSNHSNMWSRLQEFYLTVYPNPRGKRVGNTRQKAFDWWFNLAANGYSVDTEFKWTLNRLVKEGRYDDAVAMLNKFNASPVDEFLAMNKFNIAWDDTHSAIIGFQIPRPNGFLARGDPLAAKYLHLMFFSKEAGLVPAPLVRATYEVTEPVQKSLFSGLFRVFGTDPESANTWANIATKQARKWAHETGQDADKFLSRIGVTADGVDQKIFRGWMGDALTYPVENRAILFGLGAETREAALRESFLVFIGDIFDSRNLSAKSKESWRVLSGFLSHAEVTDAKTLVITDTQGMAITDMLTAFVDKNKSPHKGMRKVLNDYREWVADVYKTASSNPSITEHINPDVQAMFGRMVDKEASLPKNFARATTNQVLAAEIGLPTDPDMLLDLVNKSRGSREAQQAAMEAAIMEIVKNPYGLNEMWDKNVQKVFSKFAPLARPDDAIALRNIYDKQLALIRRYVDACAEAGYLLPDTMIFDDYLRLQLDSAELLQKISGYSKGPLGFSVPYKAKREFLEKVTANFSGLPMSDILKMPSEDLARRINETLDLRGWKRRPAQMKDFTDLLHDGFDAVARLFTSAERAEEIIPKALPRRYTKLSDVPSEELKAVALQWLKDNGGVAPTYNITDSVQQAWDLIKGKIPGLQGFTEAELATPGALRDALRLRLLDTDDEMFDAYRQIAWQVEQFELTVVNAEKGVKKTKTLAPVIPEPMIDEGARMYLRANAYSIDNLQMIDRSLDDLKVYLTNLADGKHPAMRVYSKADIEELLRFADTASRNKAEMLDVIITGGKAGNRSFEGALNRTNRVMIDYTRTSRFDEFMSNIYPFWKFPSRSIPFWIEAFAMHPQLVAFYNKYNRYSRQRRYEVGAINSKGEPLSRLEGYIPIRMPGTDKVVWFNPLAPFSFRFVLQAAELTEYSAYNAGEDLSPMARLVQELNYTGSLIGFSIAPWHLAWMKTVFNIPDHVMPAWPLLPQIRLLPPFWQSDLLHRARQYEYPDSSSLWNPQVSWHDYLVEKELLVEAHAIVQSESMTQAQKIARLQEYETAIAEKGDNALWMSMYTRMLESETDKNRLSYFTGVFTKEFSDGEAALYEVRNEINFLKAAINNEAMAGLFNLDPDAEVRYEEYTKMYDTPEGYWYRVYQDIGWVQTPSGDPIREPQERAKQLAYNIEKRRNTEAYLEAIGILDQELIDSLNTLKPGAPGSVTGPIWDHYNEQRGILYERYDPVFDFKGSNKTPDRIQSDITNAWLYFVRSTRPRNHPEYGQSYQEYEAAYLAWEANLPHMAEMLMPYFRRSPSVVDMTSFLKPEQAIPDEFFDTLLESTTLDAITEFGRANDTLFDALNEAWKELYWSPYWDAVENVSGYDRELAERKFLEAHPEPPGAAAVFAWVEQNYPGRFTQEEVTRYMSEHTPYEIEERQRMTMTDLQKVRDDIWNLMSWFPPGGAFNDKIVEAFVQAGGDQDFFSSWYDTSGTLYTGLDDERERLDNIYTALRKAVIAENVESPDTPTLMEYADARHQQEQFMKETEDLYGTGFFQQLSYWYVLEYKEKVTYRQAYPEFYDKLQEYYRVRDAYALAHPIWAKYYYTPISASLFSGAGGSRNWRGQGSSAARRSARRASYSAQRAAPSARRGSSGQDLLNLPNRMNMPAGMGAVISPSVASEIAAAFASGTPLSPAALTYLRKLMSNHPEWSNYISGILKLGG